MIWGRRFFEILLFPKGRKMLVPIQILLIWGRLRKATFCPGSLRPATDRYVRKVGRPRNDWTGCVLKMATEVAGGDSNLDRIVLEEGAWKSAVEAYCNR